MKEDQVFNQVKQSADSCEIPESIKPENLKLQLQQTEQPKDNGCAAAAKSKRLRWIVGAAAVLVAVSATVWSRNHTIQSGKAAEVQTASAQQETKQSGRGQKTKSGSRELRELYAAADDYEQVYQAILDMETAVKDDGTVYDGTAMDDMAVAEGAQDMAKTETEAASAEMGSYSATNTQVDGVDEGDVVKTDGSYLYIIRQKQDVQIVSIKHGVMEETAVISLEHQNADCSIVDLYLRGDTLQLISQRYENDLQAEGEDTYYMDYQPITSVTTYDLKDRKHPKAVGSVEQEGTYTTSRKIGEDLYLLTSTYPKSLRFGVEEKEAAEGNTDGYIPVAGGAKLPAEDIYIPGEASGMGNPGYLLITSVKETRPDKIADKKAILESANRVYVSREHLYLQREMWDAKDGSANTAIARFGFQDGKITGECAAVLAGSILDDFAIDEYEGYLRVLTTQNRDGKQTNHVYVLDEEMKTVGRIDDLAEDEQIHSARFMGEMGYFVTYRQVDPLFSVDFSNPEKPRIAGELKVSGFSEYLHFYGEDRLLGIGWETDPDTGAMEGLKLSMFDISDPSNVREVDKMVVKNVDYFPGEYNYKALTVSPEKNVIGLVTTGYESSGTASSYLVFSYDETEGFQSELTYGLEEDNSGRTEWARGVYADDVFYIADGQTVRAFDMTKGYENMGELS